MKWPGVTAAAAIAIALAGCGENSGQEQPAADESRATEPAAPEASPATEEPSGPTRLAEVAESCNLANEGKDGPYAAKGPVLFDDDMTLVIDTKGSDDSSGLSDYDYYCVLRALETPESVRSHMDVTRALDGQQVDSWDGFDARWTYHPDAGIHLIVVDTQATD